jgi:hypothetical protein
MSITTQTILIGFLAFAVTAQAHEGEDHGGVPAYVEGDAEVEVADDFASGKSETRYFIKDTSGKRRQLQLPTGMNAPNIVTSDKIKVKGHVHKNRPDAILLDENVAALNGTSSTSSTTAAAASGTRTAIAIVADFSDATVSCTDTTVAGTLYAPSPATSVDQYFQETSKTLLNFTGSVVRVKIASSIGSTCNYNSWASAANTEAAKQVSLSNFQHKIYVLPASTQSLCGWAGLGTLGGGNTWVNTCSNGRVYAHELGHNLTLHHAAVNNGAEYGDNSDVMGSSYQPVNAPHSAQLGWTPSSNILNVSQSGTYRITALETMPSAAITPQIIKIFKEDSGQYYYLALRTQAGRFAASLSSTYANRLNVHKFGGSDAFTRYMSSHGVGESFVDSVNGITVTPTIINSDTMDVRIDITAICRKSAPTISVSNPGLVAIGSSGTAYVTIKNNDSFACPSTTFALSSAMSQAGVTSSTSVPNLSVAPGASGSFTVVMQSTSTTLAGTYTGTVTGSDSANSRSVTGNLSLSVGTAPVKGKGRKPR